MPIFLAILVFGIVVLVHEWGHFIAARRAGILVEEFAIGMGPKLLGIKRGETLYTIRALPLGGFCKMYGDDADALTEAVEDEEALRDRSFKSKTILQRLSVMFAGSFMNFVLAFVLFTLIAAVGGFNTTTIRNVSPNSPAEQNGLMPGDRIVSINGTRMFLFADLQFEIFTNQENPINVGFYRDGVRHYATMQAERVGENYLIGISPVFRVGIFSQPPDGIYRAGVGEILNVGLMSIWHYIRMIAVTLVRLVTGQLSLALLMGPIGLVSMMAGNYNVVVEAAQAAEVSSAITALSIALTMLNFGAIISANLGVMNLLPLPALDGGRIFFLILESIRRKPISVEKEGMVHLAGFVLLMILMVVIAYQDIARLFM